MGGEFRGDPDIILQVHRQATNPCRRAKSWIAQAGSPSRRVVFPYHTVDADSVPKATQEKEKPRGQGTGDG